MGTSFFSQGAVERKTWHRVYMHFMHRDGWHIQFLEEDLKTSLPRKLTFAATNKIFEMHERWGADRKTDGLSKLKKDIEMGRGGIWLMLTTEEYQRLK